MLLALFGVVFAALFVLNNLVKTLLKRGKIGFVDLLLAFLASLLFVVGLTIGELNAQTDPLILTLMRNVGGGVAFFSLLIMIAEYRRPQRLRGSRGLLGFGVGLLVVLASFSIPLAAGYFVVPTPTPIQVAGALRVTTGPTQPPTLTATPRPTLTPSATRTPLPTPTATATRRALVSPTAEATATPSVVCTAQVDNNLRLRAEPSRDSETILVIPNIATLTLSARNEDSSWWYTEYEGEVGWVAGEFLTFIGECEELPVRD